MLLLLGFAYAWFLWLLLDLRPLLWWLPFASIVLLLVVDRRAARRHSAAKNGQGTAHSVEMGIRVAGLQLQGDC
jgi:hypothetical protein